MRYPYGHVVAFNAIWSFEQEHKVLTHSAEAPTRRRVLAIYSEINLYRQKLLAELTIDGLC